jgi:hypothetical protein
MRKVSADGDTWGVTSDGYDERRGVRTVVFHCLSNSQRPYRVTEVPESLLADRTLDSIGDGELGDLFNRTQIMDFSHNRSVSPAGHGQADSPAE